MEYADQPDGVPGLQQLMESSMVALNLEWGCCSSRYSVSSGQGLLFTCDKHYSRMTLLNTKQEPVISMKIKTRWLASSSFILLVKGCQPVTIEVKGGLSSSLLVYDEQDQPRLKIRRPGFLSNTFKVLGVDDIEVGSMQRDGRDWDVFFPLDLELRYKAALICACIYFNEMSERRNRT